MSDAIFERLAKATEGILAHLQKSPVFGLPAGGGAVPPKAAAGGAAAGGASKPNKPAAGAGAAAGAKPDKAAATPAKPAAKGKSKYSSEQVRDAVRQVATNPHLGKQAALDILDEDGGGVQNVSQLKEDFYDSIYEACQVALNGVKDQATEAAGDPDDPLA